LPKHPTDSGGSTFEKTFTITVNDVNEKPNLPDESMSISEKAAGGTILGTMKATDPDKGQTLTYSFINPGVLQQSFSIDPSTGAVKLLSSNLDYETTSFYSLQVAVVDNGNPSLSDTATLSINVIDEIEGTLTTVDYISPNGDNKNDYWVIASVDLYTDYRLTIFDANGIMVYNIDSGYDNSWNGKYHGKDLPVGAYYYVFVSNQDSSKSFKGTITLVR